MTTKQIFEAVKGYEYYPVFYTFQDESFPVVSVSMGDETGENNVHAIRGARNEDAILMGEIIDKCRIADHLPLTIAFNADRGTWLEFLHTGEVTAVNVEKENCWIELVCDKVSEFQQVLTAENDEPEYADVNEWAEDRAMHGGIR